MTDLSPFLTRIDAAQPADVPALCMIFADWLDGQGVCGDGWRALGVLGKCPAGDGRSAKWYAELPRLTNAFRLDQLWYEDVYLEKFEGGIGYLSPRAYLFPSRSAALAAAAEAWVRLGAVAQQQIMESK